jgi:hypothetical protein
MDRPYGNLRRQQQLSPAVRTGLTVLLGPIVWAVHLTLVYGLQSVACSFAVPPASTIAGLDRVQVAIILITLLSLSIVGACAMWGRGADSDRSGTDETPGLFLVRVRRVLALLSVLGIIAVGSAAMVLPTCAGLR